MDDKKKLHINEVFLSVQGEGYHSGQLCYFVRLNGCNAVAEKLGCARWCDTKYSWDKERKDNSIYPNQLTGLLSKYPKIPVIFTGGEPMLQLKTHWDFVGDMASRRPVCIETNGTIDVTPHLGVWITCSPKPPKYDIKTRWVDEIKLVVSPDMLKDPATLPTLANRLYTLHPVAQHYLQPLDNDLETAALIISALPTIPKWRLGLQTHKILNVR